MQEIVLYFCYTIAIISGLAVAVLLILNIGE